MNLDWTEEDLSKLEMNKRSGQVFGNYIILGSIPGPVLKNKKYVFKCSVCAEDPYLYGLGLFEADPRAITERCPCACGNFQCPEEIQYKKIKRIVENYSGFKFLGFHGDYKGSLTRCIVECKDCKAVQEAEQNPFTECDQCGWANQ